MVLLDLSLHLVTKYDTGCPGSCIWLCLACIFITCGMVYSIQMQLKLAIITEC